MTLAIVYCAAVTALLAFVCCGYVADCLHETHGNQLRQAPRHDGSVIRLRRVL